MKKIFLTVCLLCSQAMWLWASQPFSGKSDPADIKRVCDAVARWQIDNFGSVKHHELDWTNGALYRGMFEWANLNDDQRIFDFLMDVGKRNKWAMLSRVYHADDICVGQAFIEMYRKFGDKKMLQPVMERAYYVANHPSMAPMSKKDDLGKDERWSWCDALFMAPPVYAALYKMTGDEIYLDYMDNEYKACTDSLYDQSEHLYYRDCIRIPLREPNGQKQFWGRGNGWVFGGIPLILENLPQGHPSVPYYINIFQQMAESLLKSQDKKGAWHASLLDPESYPAPENSGSAFFCYGFAWGIRHGYLPKETYLKALEKGWQSLVSYVNEEGRLGYVQPVGAAPRKVGPESTEVYGVGAFLLAGSELTRLCAELE